MEFLGQVAAWFADAAHYQGAGGVPNRLLEHVAMSVAATAAAAAVALPVGLALGHYGRFGNVAMNTANVGRALPSFAVLVIALQILGLGAAPAFCALIALGIPPMVTNSYVGMRGVDPVLREAARGMGMNPRQVVFGLEIPVAMPLVMAGVRTSAVNIVATATLAALVAWGGLGRFIVDGLGQRDYVQVFAGAVLVALLSVATELGLALLQRRLVSEGLARRGRASRTLLRGTAPVPTDRGVSAGL